MPVQRDARSLYHRLGGYDAIAEMADDLLPRLMNDARLARFWANRGADGLRREKQLLVNFLCASAGGPMYYTGRDMKTAHQGMGIGPLDWDSFVDHLVVTLEHCDVGPRERDEVLSFIDSTRDEIVETSK
jgi:hemoglobin